MRIAILTNAFPYYPGEQFLEDEIGYWARDVDAQATVLPAVAEGSPRPLPPGVSMDLCMVQPGALRRLPYIVRAAFSKLFREELSYLGQSGKSCRRTVVRALLHVSKVMQQRDALVRYARRNGVIDVAYSYWNDTQAYAAILARKKGAIRRVVTRAHGIDLYQERRMHEYMPLKRQFIGSFDRIFALSTEAQGYLKKTYAAPLEKITIIPLGVPLVPGLSRPSPDGSLHIVSVSFCLPVKRMDRIIEGLRLFAGKHPEFKVRWTHIGAGPLLDEMREMARARLGDLANMEFTLVGELPNDAVKKYYLNMPVDIFMNTSESEAIPVSIMEAMSAGVIAIAPNVGGVSNLVSAKCGVLLSKSPTYKEIADAITVLAFDGSRNELRVNARKAVEERFDAAKNYPSFIHDVLSIGAS
ncbi:glycosyltransferase [Dyella sp. EPa41]|uniref:glycosyltransferase n=1 Tax=Dyella sp. EPa41 TaxID=1561194 RepID=UPI001915A26A|nr:glycosyltransferase [Dyella sp. EPa41]